MLQLYRAMETESSSNAFIQTVTKSFLDCTTSNLIKGRIQMIDRIDVICAPRLLLGVMIYEDIKRSTMKLERTVATAVTRHSPAEMLSTDTRRIQRARQRAGILRLESRSTDSQSKDPVPRQTRLRQRSLAKLRLRTMAQTHRSETILHIPQHKAW